MFNINKLIIVSSLLLSTSVYANFSGYYDVGNWTQSIGGDGFINTTFSPASVQLFGSNDGSGDQNTDFTITAPSAGTVTFSWNYTTSDFDGPLYDPFGYLLDGVFHQLTNNSGLDTQSGAASFAVALGDVFGFRQNSVDSEDGGANTIVSEFNAPAAAAVPEPGTISLLGMLLAGLTKKINSRRENQI